MKKTFFLGYDLGDGETITDFLVLDDQQLKSGSRAGQDMMTMPDSNSPGKALPTAYGYGEDGALYFASSILSDPEGVKDIRVNFKRCPSDLMGPISEQRRLQIAALLEKGWPDSSLCPELHTPKLSCFREAVTAFTNAIFEDAKYKESVRSMALDCEELVVCVGHPTRWSDLDVAIYAAILRQSVLGSGSYVGKPCSMLMAAESRAAFLYEKDLVKARLPQGTCALLIDIGSSTIDLTAMTADSRNHQYNSGSNYLGARGIDFMIRDWYLQKLQQDEGYWATYRTMVGMNASIDQALTLSCRLAKESVYSVAAKAAPIYFASFPPVRLRQEDVTEAAHSVALGSLLKEYMDLPEKEVQAMGSKSWVQLFKEFLKERKAEMTAKGLKIGRVILTGSASKMTFIGPAIREVFPELPGDEVFSDMEPSRSISKGLALVGPSNEKSAQFQKDLQQILDTEVPQIIRDDIPALAKDLSAEVSRLVKEIVMRRCNEWREGKIESLADMSRTIQADCSEEKLNRLLQENTAYNAVIQKWLVDVVSQDIAKKLQKLCDRYHVPNIKLDSLNVLKLSSISIDGFGINTVDDIVDMIATVLSLIAGLITAVSVTSIMAAITVLLASISAELASLLFVGLVSMGPAGWAVLAGVLGIAVAALLRYGWSRVKELLGDKLQTANLPAFARGILTDRKIEQEFEKADLPKKIEESLKEEASIEKIVSSVRENLNGQILKRMEDIKYMIESM